MECPGLHEAGAPASVSPAPHASSDDSLPTGRSPFALTNLIPGVTATTQDMGGAGSLQGGGTQIHGSSGTSQLLMENGLSTAAFVTPAFSLRSFNLAAAQEMTVDYPGAGAETINRLANVTTRSWGDSNRDYEPDCDLLNFNGNGECGAVANRLFGSATPEQNLDPETLEGWGNRTYNWELTGGVQHELLSGISADFTYFRRWYGTLHVVDNRAVTADDFTPFGISAPNDSRLPNGGSYAIPGLYVM